MTTNVFLGFTPSNQGYIYVSDYCIIRDIAEKNISKIQELFETYYIEYYSLKESNNFYYSNYYSDNNLNKLAEHVATVLGYAEDHNFKSEVESLIYCSLSYEQAINKYTDSTISINTDTDIDCF